MLFSKFGILFTVPFEGHNHTDAVETASTNDYLLIAGVVVAIVGLIALSAYLLQGTKKAKYDVQNNNQRIQPQGNP